jgi:hypothetical protein
LQQNATDQWIVDYASLDMLSIVCGRIGFARPTFTDTLLDTLNETIGRRRGTMKRISHTRRISIELPPFAEKERNYSVVKSF